jgi:arylsulfatase A-like enzyme
MRSRLYLIVIISIAALALVAPRRVAAATPPPNIVWIVVEDMSPNMSCYGETTIRTPNIDRLASEGVRFSRAFTTAPVCSPSRSALVTGMYQTTIGAHNHRSSRGADKLHLPEHVKLLPQYSRERGYYTVLGAVNDNRDRAKRSAALGKSDYNFVWDESVYDDNDWSGRKPDQPFFAQIMLRGGKNRGAKVAKPVDPAAVKLPPYYPDHPVLREDWARYLNSVLKTDEEVGRILDRLRDEGLADNTLVAFMTDHGISHVRDKQFLYEGGIHVPLIIRWPGQIAAGTVRDDLVLQIDLSATTLAAAGVAVPSHLEGHALFATDFKPRDHVVTARDRCDETVDRIRSVRTDRFKYIRNFYPDRSHAQPNRYKDAKPIMVTMRELNGAGKLTPEQARVFAATRPEEELYDLKDDPFEMKNLASSADHAATLADLRGKLDAWIKSTGDKGQFPEAARGGNTADPE